MPEWIDLIDPSAAELHDKPPEQVHATALRGLLAPHVHDDEPRPRIQSQHSRARVGYGYWWSWMWIILTTIGQLAFFRWKRWI